MTDVTRILNAIEKGDVRAADKLLPLVYEELRLLASQKLSQEPPGQTLQATALVHEAYIRLVGEEAQNWENRRYFFLAASEAMRRILIDNARRKKSQRHGGHQQRVDFDYMEVADKNLSGDLLELDEALTRLTEHEPEVADIVKLRYFTSEFMKSQVICIIRLTTKPSETKYLSSMSNTCWGFFPFLIILPNLFMS